MFLTHGQIMNEPIVAGYEYRDHAIIIKFQYAQFTAWAYDLRYTARVIKVGTGFYRNRWNAAYRIQRMIDRSLDGGRLLVRKSKRGYTWI